MNGDLTGKRNRRPDRYYKWIVEILIIVSVTPVCAYGIWSLNSLSVA